MRHEYLGGQLYAMADASRQHNLVAGNLFAALHRHLRGGPCRVFMSDIDVRLRIGADEIFYYPDLVVACEADDRPRHFVEQPFRHACFPLPRRKTTVSRHLAIPTNRAKQRSTSTSASTSIRPNAGPTLSRFTVMALSTITCDCFCKPFSAFG